MKNILKYAEIITGPISSEGYLEDMQELLAEHGDYMIEQGLLTNPEAFDLNDQLIEDMFGLINGHYDSEGDDLAEYFQKVYWTFAKFEYELVKPINKLQWKLSLKLLGKVIDLEKVDEQYRLYAEMAA